MAIHTERQVIEHIISEYVNSYGCWFEGLQWLFDKHREAIAAESHRKTEAKTKKKGGAT